MDIKTYSIERIVILVSLAEPEKIRNIHALFFQYSGIMEASMAGLKHGRRVIVPVSTIEFTGLYELRKMISDNALVRY